MPFDYSVNTLGICPQAYTREEVGKIATAVCGSGGGPDAVIVSQEGINTRRYDEALVRSWIASDLVEG